ncbi:MAG: MATE family efflux transporter [Pirellulaceae bacterium]|nr:MATE family efflux transporter [Pirellulaceae bacterium]
MPPATNIEPDSLDLAGKVAAESTVLPAATVELPGRLAGLSLSRQVLVLSIWPLLEQLMNFLVGVVDLALAGHLGDEALMVAAMNALGVSGYVGWLMSMIHSAAGIGSSALIARAVGGRRTGLANAALGQSLLLALFSGGLVLAMAFTFARGIGILSGLTGPSLDLCTLYLRIVALAAPASALLLVGNACLRGAGDTRSPFVVMAVVNVSNILLSVLFVYGPSPIGGHGVAGIASGTVGAWLVGAGIVCAILGRGHSGIRLRWPRLRPHWHTLRRIIRIAVPSLFESAGALWLGNFLVLMIVGRLVQSAALGAHQIVVRIEALSFLPGFAMGIAAATLAGQYLGLGEPRCARRAVVVCWVYAAIIMTLVGLVFMAVPEILVRVITSSEAMISLAPTPLRICGPFQIFLATQLVMAAGLRGAGDTRSALWITAGSVFLVRVPVVYVLGIVLDLGLQGVWYGICAEMMIRGIMFAISFWRGRWTKVRV